MANRPSKDEYYLGIAEAVSRRATCIRRHYGAVIVKNDHIVSTGYNGAPRGDENCSDRHKCWRDEHDVPHGQMYEQCRGVHAEQNAIINASPADLIGSTLYLYGSDATSGETIDAKPCLLCERAIKNAQIGRVLASINGTEYLYKVKYED